jgi:hypothetical protein
MVNNNKCKAKDPSKCWKHGHPDSSVGELKGKISALLGVKKEAVNIPPLPIPDQGKGYTASLTLIPAAYAYGKGKDRERLRILSVGDTYDEVVEDLKERLSKIDPKVITPLKNGYKVELRIPGSKDDPEISVNKSDWKINTWQDLNAYTNNRLNERERNEEAYSAALARIQNNNPVASTPKGAKALAVIKGMKRLQYFNSEYAGSDIQAAFNSIVDGTHEYTNRGWAVRVHSNYDHKGELRGVNFSLDYPNEKHSAFTQKQIDGVNKSINDYITSFDSK